MERILLLFFGFLIEAGILWQYSSSLFLPAHTSKIKAVSILGLYTVLFFCALPGNPWVNIIAYFLVNFIFLSTQCKVDLLVAVFHTAMLTAIMSLSKLFLFEFMASFLPNFLENTKGGMLIYSLFNKIIFLTIVYILIHFFKKPEHKQEAYMDYTDFMLLPIPLSCLFIMLTFFYIGERFAFVAPINIMVTISSAFLLFINLLIFGLDQYKRRKNSEFTELQLQLQKETDSAEYYKMIFDQTENRNILIHDLKKHLQTIHLLNEKQENAAIKSYIEQLLDSSDLKKAARICDNEVLNTILGRYQKLCVEGNIAFRVDIRSNIFHNFTPYDLTALFCNLMDNAMEASKGIPDGFIELSAQKKEKTAYIVVTLVNSCRNAPEFDLEHFPVSNKRNNPTHGYGIKSIKKIVHQHGGELETYYEDSEACFHTILTLRSK